MNPVDTASNRSATATILVVDDLPENRRYLGTVLRHQGYRVIEAADGAEGLASAQAERPDLVIADVLMPVMDGYELVKQLRLDPTTSRIPVVFYTAHYGEREARELALTRGVSWVLTKPAASANVLEVVVRALSGQAEPLPPGAPASPVAVDQEHLRLVTDKLAEKTGFLRTANARLRALINIGLDLASEPDADRLLENVCVAVRDLFGATYVTLGIVDRFSHTVQRTHICADEAISTTRTADWIEAGAAVPGILGLVVAEGRTLRGDNPDGDPAGLQLPAGHPEVRAFLAAPVASLERVYGWICLVGNEGRSFSQDDEQLVHSLSGQIGRIYENGLFQTVAQQRAGELAPGPTIEPDQAQRYLDTAEAIVVAVDLEARIRLVNRYTCTLLGWTADELRGRDWIEMCVPAHLRDATRQKYYTVLGGDLSSLTNVVRTRSGEERQIEWQPTLLRDDGGRIIGTLSTGIDITDREPGA